MLDQTSKVAMVIAMNVIIIIRLVIKYKMAAWIVSKVTELIDLLQQYSCLYDTKDKNIMTEMQGERPSQRLLMH